MVATVVDTPHSGVSLLAVVAALCSRRSWWDVGKYVHFLGIVACSESPAGAP